MAALSKSEYLKRYLSDGKKTKTKSRKNKSDQTKSRFTILDDDVDFKSLLPSNLHNTLDEDIGDNEPVVVAMIDERPEIVQQLERYRQDDRWRTVNKSVKNESSKKKHRHDPSSELSPVRLKGGSETDQSAMRKQRHDSDSDQSPQRKGIHGKNRPNSDFDQSPTRKQRHDSDSDLSPARNRAELQTRRNKHDLNSDQSPQRKVRHDSQSDQSPTRKNRHDSDSDQSPPRKSRHDSDSDQSPPRKNRHDSDSDQSPPRKQKHHSDSNQSPVRKQTHESQRKGRHSQGNSKSSNREKSQERDNSTRYESDSDQSPVRKRAHRSDSDQSPVRRQKHNDSDQSPPRKHAKESRQKSRFSDITKVNTNDSNDLQDIKGRAVHTLGGSKAGLSSAKEMKKEVQILRKKHNESFNKLSEDLLGKDVRTVHRDKSGRRRDLEAEQQEKDEEAAKKAELDAKYAEWGKGIKQTEDASCRASDAVHEASKPLARYRDDADLDRMMRELDREGDPMKAFMKTKPRADGAKEKPIYQGNGPPNRFGIRPGYRWDGVDRSTGFEKKLFMKQSDRKAVSMDAYKWSTEDM